jgi:hypothetical protein
MLMNGEKGQALPLAILALTIGALVVTPFLGHAGGSLIGSRAYGEAIAQQNAGDAGVEHAIWSLTRGSLAEEFEQPGDEVTYQLDETINGLTTSVTVTVNATGGGGYAGDITDIVIDSLEYDTSNGYEPYIVHVAGDIYAIAHRGSGSDGFIKTVSITENGNIGNAVIDNLEYDTSSGREPCLVQVAGDIYAIAYRGPRNDGLLKTVSIAENGDIGNWVIDTLEYDNSDGYEPCIIHVSGSIFAIAYRGSNSRGYLKTVTIDAGGNIGNSTIDTMTFDSWSAYEPSIVYVSGNVYAIAYRGFFNLGFLKTVTIAADGDIGNGEIDSGYFDYPGYEPMIANTYNDIFAIVYRGANNDGFIKTIAIDAGGDIGDSVIDTREFADNNCYELRIIHVANDIFAIVYRGPGNDGFIKTVSIAGDGDIGDTLIDSLEFDTSSCYEPSIVNVSGGILAIAYRGSGNDGFVKTVAIASAGASATYEIAATAGDRTIRAFVDIDNQTAKVISWQIE